MKHSQAVLVALLVVALVLSACGGPTPPPTKEPEMPVPIATPEPPTATTMPTATAMPMAATAPAPTATSGLLDRRRLTPAAAKRATTLTSIEFTAQALAGNLLGDPVTRTIYILLPPDYATGNKRYPVVYLLHGYGGQSGSMVSALKMPYDRAYGAGEVQDMIVVFPDGNTRLGGSFYLDSPTHGGHETYIAQELVAYIDANFRTLPRNVSRGIAGCSMGAEGAAHLGLAHPDIFSVVAAVAGSYDWGLGEQVWQELGAEFRGAPQSLDDFAALPFMIQVGIAMAAAAAPNPDNPPFYLEMPWVVSNGEVQVAPSVIEKIAAIDQVHDAKRYIQQSQRLVAFMLYHGLGDPINTIEEVRAYDKILTGLGIEHTLVEVDDSSHCGIDFMPVVKFMSEHLVGEEARK